MKNAWTVGFLVAALSATAANPLRVAVLDFEDNTGQKSEKGLGGDINTAALAEKGSFLLSQKLLDDQAYRLIDRRDFISQVEKTAVKDDGKPTNIRPSFLRAAQALNADIVLRGRLQGLSVGKQTVNQGGYSTEFARVTVRVGVEALDVTDGAIVAMAGGAADQQIRQTNTSGTTLGEEEILQLVDKALENALPGLKQKVAAKIANDNERPQVEVTVVTTADPAIVEIDGIMVGTTPLEKFKVFKGDHVITVGKPGHRDISKRILLEKDAKIEIPMMRTELSAEEMKQVLEKARLGIFLGEPAIVVTPLE